MKSYDDMFQAIRALTVRKILKIRIFPQNSCKMKAFPISYRRKLSVFIKFKEVMRFRKLWQIKIGRGSYKIENAFKNVEIACLQPDIIFRG